MVINTKLEYYEEPKLMFNNGEACNPQVGLIRYGPRLKSDTKQIVSVGIIGSNQSISSTITLLDKMKFAVFPKSDVTRYRLPFPGFSQYSKLNIELAYLQSKQEAITHNEITVMKEKPRNERTNEFARLVLEKMDIIYEKSHPPDLIIVSIPENIMEICKDSRLDKPKLKLSNGDDFHDIIKLHGMKIKTPTQIIRHETFIQKNTQDIALICWNLAAAIIYKSQKGFPWKLTYLEENTCYVGITFYKEKSEDNKQIRASMAQVFLDSGESFILRGDAFIWDNKKSQNSPHLDQENAKNLIDKVITQYTKIKRVKPTRLVIHKSSKFWPNELEGFLKSSDNIDNRDFVAINSNAKIKLYRRDNWHIVRGLRISSIDQKKHFLYTVGYTPQLRTYLGYGVPRPLEFEFFTEDPPIKKISEELLAFTKLDWNNTFFSTKEPVTIDVSRRLGSILANNYAKSMTIDPHYYYYM